MSSAKRTIGILFLSILFLTIGLHASTIYSNSFESDNGGGVVAGNNALWEWGESTKTYTPYGTNCWGTMIGQNYITNNAESYLVFQNIDLTGKNYGSVSFAIWHYTEDYGDDGGQLYISTNGGITLEQLGTYSDFYNRSSMDWGGPGWGYKSYSWKEKSIDISEYANHNILLAFYFRTDSDNNNYPGMYIDNLVVKDTPKSIAGTGYVPTPNPSAVYADETNTIEIKYRADTTFISGSKIAITIPDGWTAPQTSDSNVLGFITAVPYSGTPVFNPIPQIIGRKAIFTITNMKRYDYIKIIYGKGLGTKSPSNAGKYGFIIESANPIEAFAQTYNTPKVDVIKLFSVPYTQNFDSDSEGWTVDGTLNQWQRGTPSSVGPSSAHSGSKCWGTIINGVYNGNNYGTEELYSAGYDLRNLTKAYLQFYHYFDIYTRKQWNIDSAAIYISTNNTTWEKIGLYPIHYNDNDPNHYSIQSLPFWTGESGGWQPIKMDLSSYVGHIVFFKFNFNTYYSYESHAGWYVDDFSVLTNMELAGTGGASISNTIAPISYQNTFQIKYISAFHLTNAQVDFIIPNGWTVPQDSSSTAPGYIKIVPIIGNVDTTPSITGNVISVFMSNMSPLDSFKVVYSNAMTSSVVSNYPFIIKSGYQSQSLVKLNHSPHVQLVQKISSFPYNEDFETNNGFYESDNSMWEWGTPSDVPPTNAFSGTKCWGTILDDYYPTGSIYKGYSILSPYYDLSSISKSFFSFAYYLDLESWNTGFQILISTNNSEFVSFGSYPNFYNRNSFDLSSDDKFPSKDGTSEGWQQAQFDLVPYSGKLVRFKFRFVESYPWQNSKSGIYIDQLQIMTNYIPIAGYGTGAVVPSMVAKGGTNTLALIYQPTRNFYHGAVSFDIPADWSAPQTMTSNNPGYVFVVPLSNASISPALQISGSGPWTVTAVVSNIDKQGAICLYYNTVVPNVVKTNSFVIKTALDSEIMTPIAVSPLIHIIDSISVFPYVADFETNDNNFFSMGTYSDVWEWGDPENYEPVDAYSGSKCWGTDLDDVYVSPNGWNSKNKNILYSPIINLISESNPMYLEFSYYIDIEKDGGGGSRGAVFFISTNGAEPQQLGSYPLIYNYDKSMGGMYDYDLGSDFEYYSGDTGEWKIFRTDLSSYLGKKIQISFTFYNYDGWVTNYTHSGVYIDNFMVKHGASPIAGTGEVSLTPSIINQNGTSDFFITYQSVYDFSDGFVSLDIPAGWTAPQTSNSNAAGYISVASTNITNRISSVLQISGSGPWTVTANVTNIHSGGSFQFVYKSATTTNIVGTNVFFVKTALTNEIMTLIDKSPVMHIVETITNFPYVADFESNDCGFITFNNGLHETIWERGDPKNYAPTNAYSGMKCWGTRISNYYDLEGDYDASRVYSLYTPVIDLTSATNDMYLEFSYYHDSADWDGTSSVFFISTNNSDFKVFGNYPDFYNSSCAVNSGPPMYNCLYPGMTGDYGRWKTLRLNLAQYLGKTIQFKFNFYNPQSYEQHSGLYIDNFIVAKGFVPIAGSGMATITPVAVAPSSTNDYILKYETEYDFAHGFVSIKIPTNWSSPQTSDSNNSGYVSLQAVSNGAVSSTLQISNNAVRVEVTNLISGGKIFIGYKNAISPSSIGVASFTMKSALTTETLTALSSSPQVTILPVINSFPTFVDFESDNGGFSQFGSTHNKWEWGVPTWQPSDAYSGSKCWGTDLDDNYIDKNISDNLYTPIVDLSGLDHASIQFYHWYDVSQYDAGCVVTISTDFENYHLLGSYPKDYNYHQPFWYWDYNSSYNNMPGYSGSSGKWIREAFDLTPYVGKQVLIKFHFGNSQSDWGADSHSGWYIDDVSFLNTSPPVAGTGICTVSNTSALITDPINPFVFKFIPEEVMYQDSVIEIYFPDDLSSPETNASVSGCVSTNMYRTEIISNVSYNVLQINLKNTLPYGSIIQIKYTNDNALSSGGVYTFPVFTKGPSEGKKHISNFPVINFQEIMSLPYKEDFENDNGTWTITKGNLWEWGQPSAEDGPQSVKSGTKCWGTVQDGYYAQDSALAYLETPPINLTEVTQAYLTFYQYFDTSVDFNFNNGDGGFVEILYGDTVKDLRNSKILGRNSDYNVNMSSWWGDTLSVQKFWGGNSGGWIKQSFDLSTYTNQYIKLRFVFGSDYNFSSRPGWYIDKVSIDTVAPAQPTILYEDSQNTYGTYSTAGLEFSDIDNDGDLDMMANNFLQSYNIIWKNNGSASFSPSESVGKNSAFASVLADFNNDGYVDIFNGNGRGETVPDSPQNNEIYLNKGNGSFDLTQTIGNNITMDVAAGDIDFDGDIDLVVANIGANDLLINDGTGKFSESSILMPGDTTYVVKLFDADGDGDLDIFIGDYFPDTSQILLNDGVGGFTRSTNFSKKFKLRAVAVGDIDADGDEDLVITGDGFITVLTNTGTGQFDELPESSIQIRYKEEITNNIISDVKLADMDNDGDLDIIIGTYLAGDRIFINEGNYLFKDSNNELGFYPTYSLTLADIDKDGDLDIGEGNFSKQPNRIWNGYVTNVLNTAPSAPSSLSAVIENDTLTVNWTAGSDNQTSTNLLTYNLRVGTTENGNDVFSVTGGKSPSYFSGPGNMGHNYSFHINKINKISYYYVSVQTVDSGFRGSAWKTVVVYYDNLAPEPNKIKLSDNFLNLNNTESSILSFNLKESGKVSIYVYNIQGVKVRTLVSDKQYSSGYNYQNNITWDGTNDDNEKLAPGLYWVVIRGESFTDKKKILLVW